MRVLHFAEILTGGPAAYLNELLPYQADLYEKVVVFCPEDQKHLIDCPGVEIATYEHRGRTGRGLLEIYRQWRSFIRSASFDIVHLHSSFAGLIGRMERPRSATIVYCPHGWAHARSARPAIRRAYRLAESLLSRRTDRIINISYSEARLALEAGIPQSKCALIYSGLRDASYVPLPKRREGPLRLLFVGRYDHQKGIDLLIEVMREMGGDRYRLEAIGAPVVGKEPRVAFPASVSDLGWRTRSEITEALNRADVVVMPSRWEGFSIVALEAMRAARPIVAAAIDSLKESVVDGETGLLFTPCSSKALKLALEKVSTADLRALGLAGRRRFELAFSAARMAQQVAATYSEAKGAHG